MAFIDFGKYLTELLREAIGYFQAAVIRLILRITAGLLKDYNLTFVVKNLRPFFNATEIKRAINRSLPLYCQMTPPYFPNDNSIAKVKIVPFLLEKLTGEGHDKFYIVLGAAGTGKTTFLINLYYEYLAFIRSKKKSIILLPFRLLGIDEKIREISNKSNTILLLDGFDEDLKAVDNPKERLAQIARLASEFDKVVITIRTYFFLSAEEEPFETGIVETGRQAGQLMFNKIYLSSVDDAFIRRHLNLKYGEWKFWNFSKKRSILKLINSTKDPSLGILILRFSKELTNFTPSKYLFQTIEELIKCWINMEMRRLPAKSASIYNEKVLFLTQEVAKTIYYNKSTGNANTISAAQMNGIIDLAGLSDSKLVVLSHSWLRRDSEGEWGFIHGKILDYFLAKEIFNSNQFRTSFELKLFPNAIKLYEEMVEVYRKAFKGGDVLSVSDIFGISNKPIASYCERKDIDMKFNDAIRQDKHIIIYGSSKQGKTSLFKKHLPSDKYIVVNCSKNYELINIYKSILRQADVVLLESVSKENGSSSSGSVAFKTKIQIPLLGEMESNADSSTCMVEKETAKFETIDFDIDKAQDIIEILKKIKFRKRIVLENFHYLPEEVQYNLAFDLRNFQDENILFIIIGIWRESNRLCQYNMDLLERIAEIPVEPWKKEDFVKVAEKGGRLLQVEMNNILEDLISASFDSIGVFQELCKEACVSALDHRETYNAPIILTEKHLAAAIEKKLGDYKNSHIRSFESFSANNEVYADIPFLFIKSLLQLEYKMIENGIHRKYLEERILLLSRDRNASPIDDCKISVFIKNIKDYQQKNSRINSPLFGYSTDVSKVFVIDSTLYFFLKHCSREEILNEIAPY